MVMYLVVGMGIGSVYSLDGIRNTAIVWTVLWMGAKSSDYYFRVFKSGWLYVFILSIIVYYTALYLHSHPEIIVSLF